MFFLWYTNVNPGFNVSWTKIKEPSVCLTLQDWLLLFLFLLFSYHDCYSPCFVSFFYHIFLSLTCPRPASPGLIHHPLGVLSGIFLCISPLLKWRCYSRVALFALWLLYPLCIEHSGLSVWNPCHRARWLLYPSTTALKSRPLQTRYQGCLAKGAMGE